MQTRTEILNYLIRKNGYQRYLEIGVSSIKGNFSLIQASYKVGVDNNPKTKATYIMTSDTFFSKNKEKFDIVFIDGLHEKKQVIRDIENSLKLLNKKGTVVVHDCLPKTRIMQHVPRKVSEWTGDVWKAFVRIRETHNNLEMFVIDTDYGVGIIRKVEKSKKFKAHAKLNYDNYVKNKYDWLNIISVSQFL